MNDIPAFPPAENLPRTWPERIRERLLYFLHYSDTDLLELTSAAATVLWGIWVALPWQAFRDSRVYHTLTSVMPQSCYGVLVLTVGLVQFIGLVSHSIRLRRLSNMAAFCCWAWLAIVFAIDNMRLPEVVMYLVFAFASALVFLRIRRYYVIRS